LGPEALKGGYATVQLHLSYLNLARRPLRPPRRGVTLLEVLVAASLGVIVSLGIVLLSFFLARLNKSTFSQLKYSYRTRQTIERMAKVIRYSKRIEVKDEGMRLVCTDENDVENVIYYQDGDGQPYTLADNVLLYKEGANDPTAEVIGRWLTPLPNEPVFAYRDRTSAVEIRFRVGDPTANPAGRFQQETGPGLQGIDVRVAFGPRNNYLD
jgi:hypothetical protein